MKFFKLANRFKRDEDGAVTVDWVVLTSAVVGLAIAVLATLQKGTLALGNTISQDLKSRTVINYEVES
ncbi:hypothetical protein [uncultured Celeribacter sp.]|uniref:Flp family type IVb pilin n=1 Tax=uncultured Celeribacter sp. TaxID=1303376 RepID=UPI002AA6F392|nr:hypothetical protein [uncultured Celeribacter sp.]